MSDPFTLPRAKDQAVRPYDFRRPGKFSKEHLRTLTTVHENFARLAASYLLGTVRTVVRTDDVEANQCTLPEFVQTLADPTVLAVFSLAPLPGNSLLEISPSLVFPMLERLFGGDGTQVAPSDRPLTEIELAVVHRLVVGLLGALQEAWANLQPVTPVLQSIDTNPMLTAISSPNEVAVSIRIGASLGGHEGHLSLCLPFVTLEPLLVQLASSRWFGVSQQAAPDSQVVRLRQRLQSIEVPVIAQLASAQLTAREILELTLGDIILLDGKPLSDMTVLVGNQAKFKGRAGTMGSRLAVQLTATIAQEVRDDA